MRIIFDIGHPAHVNFFKPIMSQLNSEGHKLLITVLKRGKLPIIARNELNGYCLKFIGRHRGSRWSIIFEANILKFIELFWICLRFRPVIGVSAGSFVLGAVLKLQCKPNIQFDDDPERKLNVLLEKVTSTKLYFPIFCNESNKKVGKYNALKEWSYLSPKQFTPNEEILNEYGLVPKRYVFIREISTGSLNYSKQLKNVIAPFSSFFPANMKILFSLEDKKLRNNYPENWILLKEPVAHIHSLMYFSAMVISSGDSMAREGAILGTPSIYCGIREMRANDIMINLGMLFKVKSENLMDLVKTLLNGELSIHEQEEFRQKLGREWDDVSEYVIASIKNCFSLKRKKPKISNQQESCEIRKNCIK